MNTTDSTLFGEKELVLAKEVCIIFVWMFFFNVADPDKLWIGYWIRQMKIQDVTASASEDSKSSVLTSASVHYNSKKSRPILVSYCIE